MLAYNMAVNTEEAAGRVDTKDEDAVLPREVADDPFPTTTPKHSLGGRQVGVACNAAAQVRWRIVSKKPDIAASLQLDCSKLTGSTVVKRVVVIARHGMALTLISQEELVSQEAGLNFGVEDYYDDEDEEHPEQNWFLESTSKLVKFL